MVLEDFLMSVGVGFGFYKYTELEWNEKINSSYFIKSLSDIDIRGMYVHIITFISIRIISGVALTGLTVLMKLMLKL